MSVGVERKHRFRCLAPDMRIWVLGPSGNILNKRTERLPPSQGPGLQEAYLCNSLGD